MNIEKKVMGTLTKCYSLAPLHYREKDHILVAAEKQDACLLFDLDGNQEEVVWEGPGGVMTMVQVPGTDGQFLATQRFYSPNDAQNAKIIVATPRPEGGWDVHTLVELPFVHRFDILERGGVRYLIACTLKSGHRQKDDWSVPGKVYAAVLPDDLSRFDGEHQLELEVLMEGLTKNHGCYRAEEGGLTTVLVSAEQGVFQFTPPEEPGESWNIRQLLSEPASDAVLEDLDGDGERELVIISGFHGSEIIFFRKKDDGYQPVYRYPDAEFAHAIYGGDFCGGRAVIIGHRKGSRDLLAFTWNGTGYEVQKLDGDCGPANVCRYVHEGKDILVAANREIDEIAMYCCEP